MKQRVAMLGLGIMGGGMAGRLLAAGFPLSVYNRSADKARTLVEKGAMLATSPREAATNADVIVSMVADDVASRAMWLGENGALASAKPGAVMIECSTLSVDWVKELAEQARQRKCQLLDAPVTGTKPHAASGELNFLVGGNEKAIADARGVFEAMGKTVTHLGPTGSGALIKLINNFACAAQLATLAEALAMIERSGLNREQALAVLTGGAPGSPLFKAISARMTSRDFTPNFIMRLMVKDVEYAMKEAKSLGVDLTTAQPALLMLKRSVEAGLGEKDMSAVIEPIRSAKGS
jgi:3-hydroxyisobutyrate dehydrogenase